MEQTIKCPVDVEIPSAPADRHADRLLEALRGVGSLLILTHDNPDPDSMASALALQRLVREKLGIRVTTAYGGIVGRAENVAMHRLLAADLPHVSQVDFHEYSAIALVDTQPGNGNYSLPAGQKVDYVVDHHPARPELAGVRFSDVRPDFGATSTILAEYLWESEVDLGPELATALLFAIKTETQDLVRMAGCADVQHFLRLYPLADLGILAEMQRPKLAQAYFRDLRSGLDSARIYGRVVLCVLDSPTSPDTVAELADFLLRLEEVSWAVCMGYFEDRLYISVRTDQQDANAGDIVQEVIGERGSAGGHEVMAGARLDQVPEGGLERRELEELLTRGFLQALGVDELSVMGLLPGCLPGYREIADPLD